MLLTMGALALLAGCVGDTDPASRVSGTQAKLNAHGRTDNGPARWWWEYAQSEAAVRNGQGIKTPRRGPASSSSDVQLSETIQGLQPARYYWFRACGQDVNRTTPVCGQVRSFWTAPGDSVAYVDSSGSFPVLRFNGFRGSRHLFRAVKDGNSFYLEETLFRDSSVYVGSGLLAFGGCAHTPVPGSAYEAAVTCTSSSAAIVQLNATFSDFADEVELSGPGGAPGFNIPTQLNGRDGGDILTGGEGNDLLIGGPGADRLTGRGGSDTLDANVDGSLNDEIDCGPGSDTAYVDPGVEFDRAQAGSCEFIFLP